MIKKTTGIVKRIFAFLFFMILGMQIIQAQNQNTIMNEEVTSVDSLGYLSIITEVDSFYVVINDNFKNAYHLANKDTISIKLGKQRIRVVKKYYMDMTATINIKPDTLNIISTNLVAFNNFKYFKDDSSYPRIFWGAPVVIKTDPDANLFVDGEFIGRGLGRVDTMGYINVRSELPSGRVETETFFIDGRTRQTFFVREIYHRPEKKTARYLALLPGASQIYQDERIKGYALLGATLISSGLAIKFNRDFTTKYQQFKNTKRKYLSASDPSAAFELGNLAEKQFNESKRTANIRDVFLYGAIGIYLYSLVDGMLKPEVGYRNTIKVDPFVDFAPDYNSHFGISASYSF